MKITILGCGSSGGVPLITDYWGHCCPSQPRNRRTRTSVALHIEDQTWLIDTSPDLRHQCLRENLTHIHGVLYTHSHFDHVGGLGDLKSFVRHGHEALPIWADAETLKALKRGFGYAFEESDVKLPPLYRPFLKTNLIEQHPFKIAGTKVTPFVQDHGYSQSLGFRFSSWAYSTDVWAFDEHAFSCLQGLDLWIVDCMSRSPSPTHGHLEKTLAWIERVRPARAVLTHMGHSMDYETLVQELPPHIMPAYDGMTLEVDL